MSAHLIHVGAALAMLVLAILITLTTGEGNKHNAELG